MRYLVLFLTLCTLCNCALIEGANRGINVSSDKYGSANPARGKWALNQVSEKQEIAMGVETLNYFMAKYKQEGTAVDIDKNRLKVIKEIVNNITVVCHRPNLPWEVHLSEDKEPNAFCASGGKIMVLRGLFGGIVENDEELAAVLAHEIGHACCRHSAERETWAKFSGRYNKGKLQQAVYSTIQEDEADRVGLLYMALAGYDPTIVSNIWLRSHEKRGSNPGNYTYDHSLDIDRAKKTAELSTIARKYYIGPGIRNSNYKELLSNNDLVSSKKGSQEYRGLEALINIWAKNKEARQEEGFRESQMRK